MIKDILEKHGVYTQDLELDLLRHFEKLRTEMFASWQAAQHQVERTASPARAKADRKLFNLVKKLYGGK